MMIKLYECELCGVNIKIRSTVKSGENKGKKVCPACASKNREKKVSQTTRRTLEKRKNIRKDYPDFYSDMVQKFKGKPCAECGTRLTGNVGEIAHIISKSNNPEVATEPDNIIGLCFYGNNCHAQFDSNLENRGKMKCFNLSVEQYKKIKDKITNVSSETLYYDKILKL